MFFPEDFYLLFYFIFCGMFLCAAATVVVVLFFVVVVFRFSFSFCLFFVWRGLGVGGRCSLLTIVH